MGAYGQLGEVDEDLSLRLIDRSGSLDIIVLRRGFLNLVASRVLEFSGFAFVSHLHEVFWRLCRISGSVKGRYISDITPH